MLRNHFRFRRHCGHGRTCCWLDPVANDPNRTAVVYCGQLIAGGFSPSKVLVSGDKMLAPKLRGGHASAPVYDAFGWLGGSMAAGGGSAGFLQTAARRGSQWSCKKGQFAARRF